MSGAVDPIPIVDERLVGTWLSTDHHGYRLIFVRSGEFIVTSYGRPITGAEKWSAENGRMRLYVHDEHGSEQNFHLTYSLTEDGKKLSLSRSEFGILAKEYVRSMDKP
jgi:hypothetical protein